MNLVLKSNPALIRVVLISDQAIIQAGLRALVETQPGVKVVGAGANLAEAFTGEQPDMVLIDLNFSRDRGSRFLAEVLKAAPRARVLMLTKGPYFEVRRCVVRFGALGLLLKEKPIEGLSDAVAKSCPGEIWLDRSLMTALLRDLSQSREHKEVVEAESRLARLTAREREVIQLVADGMNNKQIAESMSIAETSVRRHMASMCRKLEISDGFELALYACLHGLSVSPRM